jgi:hypothetical protein
VKRRRKRANLLTAHENHCPRVGTVIADSTHRRDIKPPLLTLTLSGEKIVGTLGIPPMQTDVEAL